MTNDPCKIPVIVLLNELEQLDKRLVYNMCIIDNKTQAVMEPGTAQWITNVLLRVRSALEEFAELRDTCDSLVFAAPESRDIFIDLMIEWFEEEGKTK